jgi:hypothetical protein
MPFEDGGSYGQDAEDFEALTVGMQQLLITEFAINDALRVVERGRINDLLAEMELGASGTVDAGTAAEVGRLVGAKYMVFGSFIDWYGDLFPMVVDLANNITRGLDLPALSEQAFQGRRGRSEDIPQEALRLYSKALLYQDRGDTERAVELFSQVTRDFPEYTEAQEALRQIQQG